MTAPTTSEAGTRSSTALAPPPEPAPPAETGQQPLYEARLRITRMTEYGVALAGVLAGTTPLPPEGARLDVDFDGTVTGPRLTGTAAGVDYALARADGRMELHIHGRITTADGANVSLVADGVGSPGADGVVEIRETTRLHASDPRYRWVNTLALWGTGTVDMARREITVRAFVA